MTSNDEGRTRSLDVARLVPARRPTVFVLSLAIVIGFGTLALIWLLARPLALVFLALTLAESLRPIVDALARRMPHALAVGCVYLVLLAGLGLAVAFLVPMALEQARQLLDRAPQLLEQAQSWLQQITRQTGFQLTATGGSLLQRASDYLVSVPLAVGSALLEAFIVLFLSLYWLIESPRFWGFIKSLLPAGKEERVGALTDRLSSAIGGYVRGAAIDGLIVGTVAAIALAIAGVDYPVVLGLVTMFAELVPYLGPAIAGALAAVVGFLESPWHGFVALGLYVALQQIEGHLLTPAIMRSQTHVSASVVIIALLAGGSVGGVLGALTAIPLAAAVRTIITDVIAPAVRRASRPALIERDPSAA